MRKSVMAMLLVVVMLFSVYYAAAEDLDLTKMSTRDLQKLRQRINTELKNRPPEFEPEDETKRRREIRDKYNSWLDVYDFDSVISDIESGNHGMTDECASEVLEKAKAGKAMLEGMNYDFDQFTGDFRITHPKLDQFGYDCQTFPYIDKSGINFIVGFPYDSALYYDQIFIKQGGEIYTIERFDRKMDMAFDIQFERINGESWEYSILKKGFYGDETIEAIGFREDGSINKVDYVLTENESIAEKELFKLYWLKFEAHSRISHWDSLGD